MHMCNVCVCLNVFIIHEYIYIRICVNSQPPSCQKMGNVRLLPVPLEGKWILFIGEMIYLLDLVLEHGINY